MNCLTTFWVAFHWNLRKKARRVFISNDWQNLLTTMIGSSLLDMDVACTYTYQTPMSIPDTATSWYKVSIKFAFFALLLFCTVCFFRLLQHPILIVQTSLIVKIYALKIFYQSFTIRSTRYYNKQLPLTCDLHLFKSTGQTHSPSKCFGCLVTGT